MRSQLHRRNGTRRALAGLIAGRYWRAAEAEQVLAAWQRSGQDTPRITADGLGGAIVVWQDNRRIGYDDIHAQKFVNDGPTAVLLALASFDAEPDRVVLTWHRASGDGLEVTVYRRSESESWLALGRASFDGSGLLRLEDRTVVRGARYGHRAGVLEDGSEWFSPEIWVEVPTALVLGLEGLRPNPAVNDHTRLIQPPKCGAHRPRAAGHQGPPTPAP